VSPEGKGAAPSAALLKIRSPAAKVDGLNTSSAVFNALKVGLPECVQA